MSYPKGLPDRKGATFDKFEFPSPEMAHGRIEHILRQAGVPEELMEPLTQALSELSRADHHKQMTNLRALQDWTNLHRHSSLAEDPNPAHPLNTNGLYLWNSGTSAAARTHDSDTDTYTTINDLIAGYRDRAACCWFDGKFYVAGGNNTASTYEYDPSTGNWTQKAQIPDWDALWAAAYALLGDGKLHIVGGTKEVSGTVSLNTSHLAYNPATDTWEVGVDAAMPTVLSGSAFAVHEGKLHVIGGQTNPDTLSGGETNNHQVYDHTTDTWDTTRALLPVSRRRMPGCEAAGKIHVVGGQGGTGSFDSHYQYDPVADTWGTLTAYPFEVMLSKGVSYMGEPWVIAGRNLTAATATAKVYRYDGAGWVAQADFPVATDALTGAVRE